MSAREKIMARTIVFPSRNNVTYRSGFIKLTAFGSEFDQAAIEGNTEGVVDKLKQTSRVITPDFEGGGLDYLENAIKNMQTSRTKMSGTVKMIAILPIPLAIKDTTPVEWSASSSSFIDGAYGKVKEAGIGQAGTYAVGSELFNQAGSMFGKPQAGTNGLNALNSSILAVGSNQNALVEKLVTGSSELSKSVAASPQVQSYINPGAGTKQILGMNSDSSLMMFHNEAAALNGTRQIIFDPGYWQEFKGVQPRSFDLTWDIIPENHEDAINGLELCARLREFSLPQSVSGVELLSPCYWWIDWSNKYLDSQTLYSNLIINNVAIDYAQDGEWHGASTPKMFRITLSFQEAKAPTADMYKNGDNFIPVSVGASSKGSGGVVSGGGATTGSGGVAGTAGAIGSILTGSIPGVTLPSIPGFPTLPTSGAGSAPVVSPDDISKIFGTGSIFGSGSGGVLNNIKTQIADALAGTLSGLGGKAGDILGGKIGGSIGDLVDASINEISGAVGDTIKNAVSTGDFSGILDNIKTAILKEASETAGEILPNIIGGVTNKVEDVIGNLPEGTQGIFNDILNDIKSGTITPENAMTAITDKIKEQMTTVIGENVLGVLGNMPPEYEQILEKAGIDLSVLTPKPATPTPTTPKPPTPTPTTPTTPKPATP